MKHSAFHRLLALLLCFAMLLPNLTGLTFAAETDAGTDTPSAEQPVDQPWVPVVPTDIPEYATSAGKVSQELICDGGNGLTQDNSKSYFRMVTGTNAAEFAAYQTVLAKAGFEKRAQSSLPSNTAGEENTYTRWLSPEGTYVLSVYYTPDYDEVKIVADTGEDMVKSYANGYVHESAAGETVAPMLIMYGLSMSKNGYDGELTTTAYNTDGSRDCGALMVIRMPDNSLFVNDGGDLQQWSDEACADFMTFCREITGTEEGEKVVFNTWFISHAHSDHYKGLPRFIDKFHDQIDIKSVMYSLDHEMPGTTRCMNTVLKMVKAYYPDVKYYKPHTGEHFEICGVAFDVLYTQEDRFCPAADGTLDFGSTPHKTRKNGTYRECLRDLEAEADANTTDHYYDFNDTSTVLKVNFPQTLTGADRDYNTILYADANLAETVMMETLDPAVLTTDVMMVPHHGHDAHPELVAMSDANIFLYTQNKMAIYGPDGDYTVKDAAGTYRPKLVNHFVEMHEQDADGDGEKDLYFETTANRKTYWEGTETAVILFGENKSFAQAETLGFAKDSEDPAGYSVYTKAAPYFGYDGWSLLSNVIGMDSTTTEEKVTATHSFRANAVEVNSDGTNNNILISGNKYIIVHDQTDQVMSYHPVLSETGVNGNTNKDGKGNPERPGSIQAGTPAQGSAGLVDIYFWNGGDYGKSDDAKLYFTPYMRDQILWEFTLDNVFNDDGSAVKDGKLNHDAGSLSFGGDSEDFFYRSYWRKGLAGTEGEPYWTAKSEDYFRYLVVADPLLGRIGAAKERNYNTRIEFFANSGTTDVDGDGTVETCDTCVIYWHDATDKNDYRFLTVDADGNWIQKEYTSVDAARQDLASLKLRLYSYQELKTDKDWTKVESVGPQTYYTNVGTTTQELVDSIAFQLTVRDSYRRDVKIPCSGTTPMAGYYWLDGDLSTASAKQTGIRVLYRNDDGTDTLITTLTLHVVQSLLVGADLVENGVADTGAGLSGNVYESRDESGSTADRTMTLVMATADGYVRQEAPVSVTVGMLSYNSGSLVNGEAVSGDVGGLVDTDVSAGTVYTGLTLSWGGQTVTTDFTLEIVDVEQVADPAYPEKGSVIVNKTGTAAGDSFFKTGIADIQLSTTGIPVTDGVDLIVVLDMSGSMNLAASDQDAQSRLTILKEAMNNLIDTLKASDVDFRIAISDFGNLDHWMLEDAVVDESIREQSFFDATDGTDWNAVGHREYNTNVEFYNHLNFVFSEYKMSGWYPIAGGEMIEEDAYNALSAEERAKYAWVEYDYRAQPWEDTSTKWNKTHNRYVGHAQPNVYTSKAMVDMMTASDYDPEDPNNRTVTGQPNAEAFINVDSLTTEQWQALIDGLRQGENYWYGTNYDVGLEYMYRLGYAIQQKNIEDGQDREVVAVFMSDGAPMQYNYFSGRTVTSSWADWFTGEIDPARFQSAIFNEEERPAKLEELEKLMLQLLKDVDTNHLPNPDALFFRGADAEKKIAASGIDNPKDANGNLKYEDNAAVRGYKSPTGDEYYEWKDMCNSVTAYFRLENINDNEMVVNNVPQAGSANLYNAFYRNGIYLDVWGYERIARVNGYPNFDFEACTDAEFAEVDAALLALAKKDELRYPTVSTSDRYLHDANATNLYQSLKKLLGREAGYTELLQIAYRANDGKLDGVEYNLRDDIKDIIAEVTTLQEGYEWATLSPYSYFYNEDGKNWWAEAIKGDTDQLYPVINKYAYSDSAEYFGTVRNHYDSGEGKAYDGQDYIAGYRGLGIPIYTLGLSVGGAGKIAHEDTVNVLKNISSGESYAFTAYTADELNSVFASIAASAVPAASRAWFTDTVGDAYDLLTETRQGVTPSIKVMEYELDANHNRTGTPYVLEEITFGVTNENGVALKAQSSLVFTTETVGSGSGEDDEEVYKQVHQEIWQDNGLIKGRYVIYNSNTRGTNVDLNGDGQLDVHSGDIVDGVVKIDLTGDGVGDYQLQPETFFWTVGTIGAVETTLDYHVYLSGSYDEDAPKPGAGDYPTNESAVLTYNNYLGTEMSKSTVSPEFPWGKARVGFGFYLVNDAGQPIVNMYTGETGSIENAVKLTNPVYRNVTWNEDLTDNRISSKAESSVLDTAYSLFTSNVSYYVCANSDGTGQWNFQSDATGTTYVQYGNVYTNTTISDGLGLDDGQIHDTVVWFAVKRVEGLSVDKTVDKTDDHYTLTLEAFANGATSQISAVKPADIVLVLDQSASMYTPAGMAADRLYAYKDHPDNLPIPESAKIDGFAAKVQSGDETVLENASHLGYYIAVHNTLDYLYIVQYVDGGWYYVPVDMTTRAVQVDTTGAVQDGVLALFEQNSTGNTDINGNPIYFLDDECTQANKNLRVDSYATNRFGTYTQKGNAILPDSLVTYYKTQYGALYESVHEFIANLQVQALEDQVNHRVAIVGFASPYYENLKNHDGTGIYVDGQYHLYADGITEYYASALADISTPDGMEKVQASINAITTNYLQTCPAIGLRIARSIFRGQEIPLTDPGRANTATTAEDLIAKADPTGSAPADRDQIVILFTDGNPTVSMYSQIPSAYENDVEGNNEYCTPNAGVRDAINEANAAKREGVKVYTIGTAAASGKYGNMGEAAAAGENKVDFLNLVSSDYPNSSSVYDVYVDAAGKTHFNFTVDYGTKDSDDYSLSTVAGDDLNIVFGKILDSVIAPTVELDSNDILRDVLSDYFDLLDPSGIKVYTAAKLADGSFAEKAELTGAVVTLGMTDPDSGRYDIVDVSGYDYKSEYLSSEPRTVNGEPYYGSKLIVEIPVKVRDGFWGGNQVPTNEDTTAIYDLTFSGDTVVDQDKVIEFPVPHVNIPVRPAVQAKDQVVYYGLSGMNGMDLLTSITVGGVAVGTDLKPAEDWMDDYATLSWADGSATPQTAVSGTQSSVNTFTVVLKPVSSTDAGVGELIPADGYTAADTGSVQILVPVLTFRDSMVLKGKETNSEYYNTTNYAGDAQVKWVDMDNAVADGKTTPDLSSDVTMGQKPAITLSYTPEGAFNEDTAVNVTVYLDGQEANGIAWFDWQSCANSLHDEDKIALHKANQVQVDFWIHVSSITDDPNGLITDKYVTATDKEGQYLLTLEAYATGTTVTKPADIVLVLDHSASMYTPAGAPKVLDNTTFYELEGKLTKNDLDPDLATHKGYYVAQNSATNTWFVIKHIPTESEGKRWQCYEVPDTERIVNEQDGAWTQHTQTLYYSNQSQLDDALVFYKSQYAVLYDSVLSFVKTLRESEVAHNVSIVGFAGYGSAGTRLYVGGDEAAFKTYASQLHNNNTSDACRTELYQKAMKNVAVDSEYEELLMLVESIETNYSYTSPASGMQLANEVLAANPVDPAARDRVVILFTDGIPNRAYQQGDDDSSWTQDSIYDQAVQIASATKKTYGAKVFTISTATMGSGEHARDFLHYMSSDYPNATGYTTPGAAVSNTYTLETTSSKGLTDAFKSITSQMSATKVTLNDTTLLVEVLSKYFDFLNDGQQVNGTWPDVRIYTQKYLGQGNWGDKVLAENITLDVTSTSDSGEGRKNKVVISGFNYAAEYVADGDSGGRGSKLVVEVDIKTREGFWGGDNVITNDASTGLYTPGTDVPVDSFPVPDTDVPTNLQIEAEGLDRVVYFGGLNSYVGGVADKLDITDLMQITAGGVGVIITPDGKFVPVEEWMDDYVTIDWADGYTKPNVSNTQDGEYSFSVTLTNNSGETSTAGGTGSVTVLVPQYTFNDTTVPMGYEPTPDSENRTSGPVWVTLDGTPGVASDPNTVPTLTLSYDVSGPVTEETPVQVTVSSWTNPDNSTVSITDALLALVKYHWVLCQDGKNHSTAENVDSHFATADSIEFTIHVGSTIDDQVVIDFGLSVDIDVRKNDVFGSATLVGLFNEEPSDLTKGESLVSGSYGELELHDGDVRYTLTGPNAMQMQTPDTFWYVISYQIGENTAYDCGKLDVIPATIIYYEDSFIDFSVVTTEKQNGTTISTKTEEDGWSVVYDDDNQQMNNATQSESRPGDLDPESIYGYDSAYASMAKYSLGSARKINVFSRTDENGKTVTQTGRATFTFSGTGFDVVSLTSNTSGSIIIRLYEVKDGKVSDTVYKTYAVDTYYGYVYDSQTGEWTVDPDNADNALYQIPIMKVSGLTPGTYNVVISASYNTFFDHDQYADNSYDFYLDAIRIYNPAQGDVTAEGVHQEDGEGWPSYQELRDLLISADSFNAIGDTDGVANGIVFIDGRSGGGVSVSDYQTYGPNNELYLKPGQSVAFELNKNVDRTNMDAIHLGIKNVGEMVGAQIYAVDDNSDKVYDLTVNSATDLYYDITDLNGYTVVIKNSTAGDSNAILSLTNIKTTFAEKPVQGNARSFFTLRRSSIDTALDSVVDKDTLLGIDFIGATLSFKDEIFYNIIFDVINVNNEEISEIGLITWTSETDGDVFNAEYRTTELGTYTHNGIAHQRLRSQSIAAKNMGEELYFKVYMKLADGSVIYSGLKHYSARTYATNMLNKDATPESMKALCVALMNYGAAAQVKFGYKTDDLMNADLTAEQQALVPSFSEDMLSNVVNAETSKTTALTATGGFKHKVPSINFGGAFGINYNFTTIYAVEGELKLYVWTAERYNAVEELTLENASQVITMTTSGNNAYSGRVNDIAAKNMEDTVYVCGVYEADGVTYRTGVLAYSVAAYMESVAVNTTGENQAMAQACAVYGWAAKCHFNVV